MNRKSASVIIRLSFFLFLFLFYTDCSKAFAAFLLMRWAAFRVGWGERKAIYLI
ncbi:hypothetical protein M441DRAFT_438250 [Trichoderma asperellum CBS 433.97]|uniref:Uncharacterized protein n=1 Tax=Trichoderma asperellum (strain ATCC 204424 / CBS 433.97 / NBRC 101777) TaxID=1042311 RepID=A0A2T3Z3S5_TRIA4|nr:hypothetical protein M441DRAFT_438250 [Trichoderma asperellum CBS 433.97]PTB39452.1 hypothetical protein M441DRAFT_438250 [Trichoderma asperellum CBS 433.97]